MLEEGKKMGVLQACWHVEEEGHEGLGKGHLGDRKKEEEGIQPSQGPIEEPIDAWKASWSVGRGRHA